MAKNIIIPGKEIIDSFENLSVESKMVAKNDKHAKEILDAVGKMDFIVHRPILRSGKYSISIKRQKSWWKIKWAEDIAVREWRSPKKGELVLPYLKSEPGFGKFIALGSVLYWMHHGDYAFLTIQGLKPEGLNFWGNFLGFRNDKAGFLRFVLETDGGSCKFIKVIGPMNVVYRTVNNLDEMEHDVGHIEEYISSIQDFTLPYSDFLDRVKEVWKYKQEKNESS